MNVDVNGESSLVL